MSDLQRRIHGPTTTTQDGVVIRGVRIGQDSNLRQVLLPGETAGSTAVVRDGQHLQVTPRGVMVKKRPF